MVRRWSALRRDFNPMHHVPGENAESAMLITSLRDVIRNQANELESLQNKLKEVERSKDEEVSDFAITP